MVSDSEYYSIMASFDTCIADSISMTKVSKGKHRGKKQEKEETESAAEPEGEQRLTL